MKKQKHRLLTLILSLILVVGLIPGTMITHAADDALLPAPVVTVDENGVATWPEIEGAARYGYSISTGGGWLFTNECDIPATLALYGEESGTYTLTIWAADDDKNQISEKASVEYSYTKDHVHEWATDWTYNDYDHWHECVNTPCALSVVNRSGYGPHVFSADGVCVCGKEGEPASSYKVTAVGGNVDKPTAEEGDTITITAYAAPSGEKFAGWTTEDGVIFADASATTTTFVMPAKDVTVTATYEALPTTYHATVVGGTADKYEALAGETITIKANDAPSGKKFVGWKVTVDEMFVAVELADENAAETTFEMPEGDVRVDAVYEALPATYHATVVGGTADKYEALAGETITIKANDAPSGKKFVGWKVTVDEMFVAVELADENAAETTFEMPEGDVRVDAVYEALPATYHATVVGGTADKYEALAGETITIKANDAPSGKKFVGWKVTVDEMFVAVELADENAAETTFEMPEGDVRVDAVYEALPATYHATVVGGTADKYEALAGETITIKANDAPSGKKFVGWKVTVDEMFVAVELADENAAETTFEMPEGDVRVDAVYEALPATYHATVVGGTADKYEALAGETITIKAYDAPSGKKFVGWKVTVDEMFVAVELADENAAETTFEMPEGDVRVDAVYEEIPNNPSDDKDDVNKPSDKEDKPEADKAPQTGDDSNMFMWFAAMILAGITGLGIFRKRRAE